ncbi:SusC/RagA family TonB-linked outer membrane protein [Flavobacterium sharifuzzamanii]|uniref:SusC/RagA family TonB-linked outer membrane protein n=1 Tax=Flavobacterium sharifuzzamanii TaxID=2211133 RepID=UPI000DACD48E|nr:SusC/RagA family TonB-linked outer membrane protein [Flavobacterium sharifuzzamanii]KAF2079996.1 SusC/RagA family TonB-linked outer membrane protein [Flavobacterium sharifuzzamanii]
MKQALIKRCSFLLFTLMSVLSYAQSNQVTVTGTVTDNLGGLLPGVNVTEKSTKNSVTTDYNGKYEIKVKSGGTLVFSFIGMKKIEIPLNNRSIVNAKMEDDFNQLENIVVVGYGTQKKKELTGAIATIKPDELMDLPVTNLSDALKGLVPGLTVTPSSGRPGDAGSIQIRQTFGFSKDGNSTIPLVVIDDMVQVDPATGKATLDTFNRLDPSEIESVTVLKDASAAIYGSRASQGAIIVKTKRGKAGKAKFSYNSQFVVNDAVSHTKTMSAYEFGVFSNRFLTAQNPTILPASLFSAAELEEMKGLDYDWLKEAWKPAIQQKHSFNVNGGSEDITYFAGATYLTQDANLGYQKYDKWNYRTGINAKIAKNLDFSASISGNTGFIDKSFTKASANISDGSYGSAAGGEQADYGYLVHMPKFIPWQTIVDGKEYYMSPFPNTNKNFGSANANNNIAGWNYFANLNNGSHQTTDDASFNVNASLNYKVEAIKGLSFKATFARTKNSSYSEQIQLPYDLARITNYQLQDNHLASAAYPSAITKNPEVGGMIDYAIETNVRNSRVYYNSSFSKSTQANFFANYNRTFGDHNVSGMFGVERSESDWQTTRLAYTNTPKDYLGDWRTAGTVDTGNSTALKGNNATLSYFGTVNYNFKSKYLVQFLIRSDASTKFAPENYWGTFPSLQLGWVASKEEWFQRNLPGVNFFKLRYSIGKTGKDNLQPFKWYQYYDLTVNKGWQFGPAVSNGGGGVLGSGLTPKVNPNRDAKWDSTLKHNLGFDLAFLKNRLEVNADFYYDITKDMLTDMGSATGVPISVGGAFAEQNYAQVDAWGSELNVNWNDKIGKVGYSVGMNFSYGDNKIKRFPDQGNLIPSNNTRREGYSEGFNPVWGFQTWKGTSTGDGILRTDEDIANYWSYLSANAAAAGTTPSYLSIVDPTKIQKGSLAYQDVAGTLNPDGSLSGPNGQILAGNDYVKLANSSRTYTINTNLGFKYSNLSVKTQIVTSWGGANFVDLMSQPTSSASNMWSRETFWNDMYAADNVNGKYPNLAQTGVLSPSDFWQISTFRCFVRNLTVAYEIPKQVFANTKVNNISIGITGNNLWDFYNPYPDHYRNMYDNSSVGYPTLRSWSFNFNISF